MSIPQSNAYRQEKENFHLIPGRLRIGVPGLLNNQQRANTIAHRLAQFPGVKICYANPVTGQILVIFDHHKTDLKSLLSWISKDRIGEDQRVRTLPPPHYPKTPDRFLPNMSVDIPWHSVNSTEVLKIMASSPESGLCPDIVEERLKIFGPNELDREPIATFLQIAAESLKGFMPKLLLIAGGVSLLVGETTDAIIIGAIVILQAVVEAIQSQKAEKSLEKLKELSDPLTTVIRGGDISKIPSRDLVPGDILKLGAGDMVPADAKIVTNSNLLTNEACLTGESIPVIKNGNRKMDLHTSVADRANMIFAGTGIISGQVTAVVVHTGMETELGRIARLLGDVKDEKTNLQKQLDYLGRRITHIVVISVGTIAVISLIRGRSIWEVLRAGISLAVGAVPEGLPAVLTVALATGVRRMVKRNAVVRKLSAVETLGSTTVICADKTGTLTNNEMTAKELYTGNEFYSITGDGYGPEGEIHWESGDIPQRSWTHIEKTLKVAVLCNNAELKPSPQGKWRAIGDPTEGALLSAAAKAGLWWQDLKVEFCRQKEIAFSTQSRTMTVVCRKPNGEFGVYVKGAPDEVIKYCTSTVDNQDGATLDLKIRNRVLAVNEKMASKALRVLATAYKTLPPDIDIRDISLESELIFCGLIGMTDSPRKGVYEAIQKCHRAGVRVVMITGDHRGTAEALASKLGILNHGQSITGKDLDQLSDEKLNERAKDIVVYSRTTPDQKLRIVRALKSVGHIVAMTGDGVNDAPAVKEANVGIAMGQTGTDVTREVASITLSDDNFVTIVNGIEEGRTVGRNLAKSISYILVGSLGQLFSAFSAVAVGLPAPLVPSQILWVNLVTESLPAMALTADPPEKDYMSSPPINLEGRFLVEKSKSVLRKGLLFGLNTFGIFTTGLIWAGWSLEKARTMAFSQLVMNRVYGLIHERRSPGSKTAGIGQNPLILPAALVTVSMLAATIYIPLISPWFSTMPLHLKDWALVAANALVTGKVDNWLEAKERSLPFPKPYLLPAPKKV